MIARGKRFSFEIEASVPSPLDVLSWPLRQLLPSKPAVHGVNPAGEGLCLCGDQWPTALLLTWHIASASRPNP